MTREEILKLEADGVTDELVAEKVMKWTPNGEYWMDGDDIARRRYWDSESYSDPFEPSANISDAFEVVEKLNSDVLMFDLFYQHVRPGGWHATFRTSDSDYAQGETPELAICRAALLVVVESHDRP